MQLDEFDYTLPKSLIAQQPLPFRRDSRLMLVDVPSERIEHAQFADFPSFLGSNDVMVMNNTEVIPARLEAVKATGGKVSIQVERVIDPQTISAQISASKKPKVGSTLDVNGLALTVVNHQPPFYTLKSDGPIQTILDQHGHMPLPPYMQREATAADLDRYQTVYASAPGAVAAPTAGLHFDDAMLGACRQRGTEQTFVTLHVGAGTFTPVRVENIHEHRMHAESIEVNEACCDAVACARAKQGRVFAIGTTSLRALESAARVTGKLEPFSGETRLFITPGDDFHVVDCLLTNFHLPKSTLLMLVSAFAGMDLMRRAYQEAIDKAYRFYSYGDAMLIRRKHPLAFEWFRGQAAG